MNNISNDLSIERVLEQMRTLANQRLENADVGPAGSTSPLQRTEFSSLLKESLHEVNALQQEAGRLRTAYETGDASVDIPEVMIAVEKASLSFQAATEIRNKLLSAYQEVMNMQI